MRARSAAAVFAGAVLGLLIIGSTVYFAADHPGSPPYAARLALIGASPSGSGSTPVPGTTTDQGSSGTGVFSPASGQPPIMASQVNNFERQPITHTAVVFLPVIGALFLGLLLYRASARRSDELPQTVS